MLQSKYMNASGVPFPSNDVWYYGMTLIRTPGSNGTITVYPAGPPASGAIIFKYVLGNPNDPFSIRLPTIDGKPALLPAGWYVQLTTAEVVLFYRDKGPQP